MTYIWGFILPHRIRLCRAEQCGPMAADALTVADLSSISRASLPRTNRIANAAPRIVLARIGSVEFRFRRIGATDIMVLPLRTFLFRTFQRAAGHLAEAFRRPSARKTLSGMALLDAVRHGGSCLARPGGSVLISFLKKSLMPLGFADSYTVMHRMILRPLS
jgi:hypothetical protein